MKNLIPGSKPGQHASFPLLTSLVLLLLFFVSCNEKRDAYTLLEFQGIENVNNYTKSFYLINNKSDSLQPAAILGSKGDLFSCDEYVFVWNGDTTTTMFSFSQDDSLLLVNEKIYLIDLPDSGIMNSWSGYPEEWDLSNLQFISINSKSPGQLSALPAKHCKSQTGCGISLLRKSARPIRNTPCFQSPVSDRTHA